MKGNIIKALLIAFLAINFMTQAEASPWWWPGKTAAKTPVKTEQVALPANNGGLISVTIPSRSTSLKHSGGSTSSGGSSIIGHSRSQSTTANRAEDERIAADLERHF